MRAIKVVVCALANIANIFVRSGKCGNTMLAIRLYICALTTLFLLLVIAHSSLGVLEAVVITCALVYLILDVRADLQSSKSELRLLQELEKRVSLLLR